MKSAFRIAVVFCFVLIFSGESRGQYFGERVLEKTFEQSEFFFTPFHLIPFGLGSFKSTTPGLLDDPLLNLVVNPARLYGDSITPNYLYVDFRSSREIRSRNDYHYPILMLRTAYVTDFVPFPRYFVSARKELEPVFSGALLSRPFTEFKNLFLGITYQAVVQDEQYYPIPQDIYRSVLGYDYLGLRSAAENIPIVDKYSGTDRMHRVGHFVSFFSGYDISPNTQVGIKLSRVVFDRDGSFGSKNLWESSYRSNAASLWSNSEGRSQNYKHWDVAAGLKYRISERNLLGVTAGRLWGDVDQELNRNDSSYYSYGQINTDNWSYYSRSGRTNQNWVHDGKTSYLGGDFTTRITPTQALSFYYLYTRQNIDISLASIISDTSYSAYRYRYNDTTLYVSTSDYQLGDVRGGTGNTTSNNHRLMAAFQWRIEPRMNLNIGVQWSLQKTATSTNEHVIARRHSRYNSAWSYSYNYYDAGNEEKDLLWDFQTELTTVQIPIIFTWRVSDYMELLLGLNRAMSSWELEDVTLALFNYRETNSNGTITRKENFGERYTYPKETVTDVKTTALGGITVSPSTAFNIRLLVVPNFVETFEGTELQDFQWWVSLNLMP